MEHSCAATLGSQLVNSARHAQTCRSLLTEGVVKSEPVANLVDSSQTLVVVRLAAPGNRGS